VLVVVPDAGDADVVNVLAADELLLELGGSDLEALCKCVSAMSQQNSRSAGERTRTVLDEFLDAVGDVEVALVVHMGNVSGLEVALLVERVLLEIRPLPVALKDVGSLHEQLARLTTSTG
jgi:hypothetical protein